MAPDEAEAAPLAANLPPRAAEAAPRKAKGAPRALCRAAALGLRPDSIKPIAGAPLSMSHGHNPYIILQLQEDKGVGKAVHQSPADFEILRHVFKARKDCGILPDLRKKRVELV
ncbi:MAG TPA: hypothetical protein VGG20_09105 [Thermoanaerobaculia bacterium]